MPPFDTLPSVPINIPEVLDRLCYRYPSPLVDAVTEHEPGRRIVAVKNVTVNEDFFQGHFPGAPLMPGVLMIETLAQVATILLTQASADGAASGRAYLRGVDNAKFRLPVVPGDRLRLEVTIGAAARAAWRARTRRRYIGEHDRGRSGAAAWRSCPSASPRDARVSPSIRAPIVHPDAVIGAGTVVGPHAIIGDHVRLGPRLPHRRLVGRRRPDRDRRRQRDFPVRVDWPDSAGPEVPRRADEAASSAIATCSASSSTIHRGTAGGGGVTRDRRSQRVHGLRAHRARLPRRQPHDLRQCAPRSAATSPSRTTRRSARSPACTSSAASGKHAFIGGFSVITKDALPFAKTVGNRARIYGLNTIGLVRRKFSSDSIAKLRRAYRHLLHSNTSRALAQIERDPTLNATKCSTSSTSSASSSRGVGLRRPSRRLEEVVAKSREL